MSQHHPPVTRSRQVRTVLWDVASPHDCWTRRSILHDLYPGTARSSEGPPPIVLMSFRPRETVLGGVFYTLYTSLGMEGREADRREDRGNRKRHV